MASGASPQEFCCAGVLFDMDGTIIDSTDAIVKHWNSIGNEIGTDPDVILQTSHGRRTIDVLKDLDPSKANWEYICHMEGLIPQLYAEGAHEIPGARSLIDSLSPLSLPWAIVTSGTKPLVKGWFKRLNLPLPEHLVTAEDVERGKPDPTCYKMGLKYLDLEQRAGEVLVVEDSPAGIRAGLAAGCKVLGLVTSHTLEQVRAAEPTWIVTDLASVKAVKSSTGGVVLQIRDVIAQT